MWKLILYILVWFHFVNSMTDFLTEKFDHLLCSMTTYKYMYMHGWAILKTMKCFFPPGSYRIKGLGASQNHCKWLHLDFLLSTHLSVFCHGFQYPYSLSVCLFHSFQLLFSSPFENWSIFCQIASYGGKLK